VLFLAHSLTLRQFHLSILFTLECEALSSTPALGPVPRGPDLSFLNGLSEKDLKVWERLKKDVMEDERLIEHFNRDAASLFRHYLNNPTTPKAFLDEDSPAKSVKSTSSNSVDTMLGNLEKETNDLVKDVDERKDLFGSDDSDDSDVEMGGENAHKKRGRSENISTNNPQTGLRYVNKNSREAAMPRLPPEAQRVILNQPTEELKNKAFDDYLNSQLLRLPREKRDLVGQESSLLEQVELLEELLRLQAEQLF
jgi:hypothetical protein